MDRRIVWAARAGTRRELVQRDVGALARDRRGQLLCAVAMSRAEAEAAIVANTQIQSIGIDMEGRIDFNNDGQTDFAISTDTPFIYAAMRGLRPIVIATYSRASGGAWIVVRNDRIKKPADFAGKSVA